MRRPVSPAPLLVALLVALSAGPASAQKQTTGAAEPAAEPAGKAGDSLGMTWTGILSEDEFLALHELADHEVPELRGATVDLAGGKAYLSLPEGEAPFPAVVVIQEWWGLNDNIKHWTDRLAADGYAALAVDLYDGTVATTREEAMAAMQSVQDDRAAEILNAGCDFLKEDERVQASALGSIGWCFGGGWSLRTAIMRPDLDAAVIYYGRLTDDPDELRKIQAGLLGIFGNQDQGIPPEAVNAFERALEKADVEHEILRYDANHAFANPSGARYDQEAAADAWEHVREFLAEELKGQQ
jgi:carboxymethylenebutenolidase